MSFVSLVFRFPWFELELLLAQKALIFGGVGMGRGGSLA